MPQKVYCTNTICIFWDSFRFDQDHHNIKELLSVMLLFYFADKAFASLLSGRSHPPIG